MIDILLENVTLQSESRVHQHYGIDRAGLTQVQLAKKLRRPQSFVSKYETGERRLDVVEFLEIAKALSADPADLIRELVG